MPESGSRPGARRGPTRACGPASTAAWSTSLGLAALRAGRGPAASTATGWPPAGGRWRAARRRRRGRRGEGLAGLGRRRGSARVARRRRPRPPGRRATSGRRSMSWSRHRARDRRARATAGGRTAGAGRVAGAVRTEVWVRITSPTRARVPARAGRRASQTVASGAATASPSRPPASPRASMPSVKVGFVGAEGNRPQAATSSRTDASAKGAAVLEVGVGGGGCRRGARRGRR